MEKRPVTKEYRIDLRLPEEERWSQVIRREASTARNLIHAAARQIPSYDAKQRSYGVAMTQAIKLIHHGYRLSGGHYQGEIAAWAEATGVPPTEVTLMNCLYELNHLAERRAALGSQVPEWLQALISFGCTAGAVRLADGRAVHVRNMDWPLQPIRTATRLFRFTDGDREFVTVGLPGLVGALSGMVPGAYSVTINYAPPTFLPGFAFGPLFLLRQVFETCDTYEDACEALSHTRLSANVLFLVCSAEGTACAIERTREDFARIPMRGGTLAVANHYRSGKLSGQNRGWDPEIIAYSKQRASTLDSGMKRLGPRATLAKAARILDEEPVCNEETHQMMAFDPSRGDLLTWKR